MEIFGSGGGEILARRLSETLPSDVQLLGSIPLETALRIGGDSGRPLVLAGDSPAAQVLKAIAGTLASRPRGLGELRLTVTPKNN